MARGLEEPTTNLRDQGHHFAGDIPSKPQKMLSLKPSKPVFPGFRPLDGQNYRIIGRGTAGTVFEIPGTDCAIKKGSDTKVVWNDFLLTNEAQIAFLETRGILQEAFPEVVIPRVAACTCFWLPDYDEYWMENLSKFPESHRNISTAFLVDKIPSLSFKLRERLIDEYFEDNAKIQEEAQKTEGNQHCLVRVYMGENESDDQKDMAYDSLENFPMRLNMLEDCVDDVRLLAAEMAIALTVIHWQAQIDAMDCEFVLGGALAKSPERRRLLTISKDITTDSEPRNITEERVFNRRDIEMWVLDFDKASRIDLTEEDVDKRLVPAFLGNDPYFPRPDVDMHLWDHFSKVYLKASHIILSHRKVDDSIMILPLRFLRKVEAMVEKQKSWDLEERVVFG